MYAALDLGSNSFHLLVVRKHLKGIQTIMQMKRKVRLASGLDSHNRLSDDVVQRALNDIQPFAEQLTTIQLTRIRVVAAAALRVAINADEFIVKASQILATPIEILSGEQEAELISIKGYAKPAMGQKKSWLSTLGCQY